MKKLFLLFLPFTLMGCQSTSFIQQEVTVIPRPMEIEYRKGFKKIDSLTLFSEQKHPSVSYQIDSTFTELGEEGYLLDINSKGVFLKAKSETGLFYGKTTLRQLYTPKGLPKIMIRDKPRFPYRGLLLDVSRHFFTKDEVKKLIDIMSDYKLNTLQWHLTDDGGWRMEIDGYPRLTQLTSHRTDKIWQKWWETGGRFLPTGTPKAEGGFYTKADIREIVSYAASKSVHIVPEIEFPGHSRAVLAAYPELSCTGEAYSSNVFCAGNQSTYAFMDRVLNEVMDLFPSEIVHIGGDETNTSHWNNCPKCKKLMEKENMKDVHELHAYIIRQAERILNNRDRRLAGWDEIMDETLDQSSIITSWQGDQFGSKATKQGYDVIFAPLHYLYLDYFQSSPNTQPLAHDGYTTLKKVYHYEPPMKAAEAHILGVQAQLWTEWISDMPHLEYMAFPRTFAVAEIGWSQKQNRSWQDFKRRLPHHMKYLKSKGINAYTPSSNIDFDLTVDSAQKTLSICLRNEDEDAEMRYTTDGTVPTRDSRKYVHPLVATDSIHLVAAPFKDDSISGELGRQSFYYHKAIGKNIMSSLHNSQVNRLIDGQLGGKTYLDGNWLNFSGNQEFVIDLSKVYSFNMVSSRWMQLRAGARRNFPDKIEVYCSLDGKDFQLAGNILKESKGNHQILQYQQFTLEGKWKARYVLLKVFSNSGGMSVDEIIVF